MNKICKNCTAEFEISESDLVYLNRISPGFDGEKIEIPAPSFCPDCRQQRRISWRNERSLYRRVCSQTGKQIIAMYPQSVSFPVFDNEVWWGDSWDGKDYAQEIDFDRPFFEQLMELRDKVPHMALAVATTTCQNSDYVNHAGYLKDCYLIFNSDYSERCMYSKGVNRCYDCLDCFKIYDCEACYECMNSYNCKFCTYVWDSYNSSECDFSYNLVGCKNCFLCVNLQNQQYCFKNQRLSEEEWKKRVSEYRLERDAEQLLAELMAAKSRAVLKRMTEKNTENCSGDYLANCKDCEACFDCEYLERSKYCYDLKKGDGVSYGNMDLSAFGVGVVESYEGGTVGYNDNHCLFCENVWESSDVYYSLSCMNNCKDCFGCVGLKKDQYCILNKQYTREEYEEFVPRIIEKMRAEGEWGEFFPSKFSPHGYNDTMAQEYYPMNREQVEAKGWKWKETDSSVATAPGEDILLCEQSGKSFKLLKLEKDFYAKMKLPLPKYCPDVRHLKRLRYRNPRRLWDRECGKCRVAIQTTFAPERLEQVYCEKCYLETVY